MKNEKFELLEESVKVVDSTLATMIEFFEADTPTGKVLDEQINKELDEQIKILSLIVSLWDVENGDTLPDFVKEYVTKLHMKNVQLLERIIKLKEKQYRTRAKSGSITDYPQALITITRRGYENSITLREKGAAFLMKLRSMEGLEFKDGKLYIEGLPEETTIEVVRNLRTMEGIDDINLPLLRYFYSIIYQKFDKTGDPSGQISLYLPDLARAIGHKGNIDNKAKNAIIKAIYEFHPLIGCIGKSCYAVLVFLGYNAETNTITFYSPYMEMVINKTFYDSIKHDKRGKIRKNKQGAALVDANHSYLIASGIVAEKNKHAVNNVIEIIRIIEQAGNNTPHVTPRWLLENNTQFLEAFQNKTPGNKTSFAKSVFKKTLQLLRTHTHLEEVYRDIELPDPDDAANIPTQKTLDSVIYSFPHKGKRKRRGENRG